MARIRLCGRQRQSMPARPLQFITMTVKTLPTVASSADVHGRLSAVALLLAASVLAGCQAPVPEDSPVPNNPVAVQDTPAIPGPSNVSAQPTSTSTSASSTTSPPSTEPTSPPNEPQRLDNWSSPENAAIFPGVWIDFGAAIDTCSSSFVFTNANRTEAYLSTAAHCTDVSDGDEDCLNAQARTTPITIEGATRPLAVAYNSFVAMKEAGVNGTDPETCLNDFSLLRIDPEDWTRVSPAVIRHGGPAAVATLEDLRKFPRIFTYGYGGSAAASQEPLRAKYGEVSECNGDLCTAGPQAMFDVTGSGVIVPGDSGSVILTSDRATSCSSPSATPSSSATTTFKA